MKLLGIVKINIKVPYYLRLVKMKNISLILAVQRKKKRKRYNQIFKINNNKNNNILECTQINVLNHDSHHFHLQLIKKEVAFFRLIRLVKIIFIIQ